MSKNFLIIEDRESDYNQLEKVFTESGLVNIVGHYDIIDELMEDIKDNLNISQLDSLNKKLHQILKPIKTDTIVVCDLNLFSDENKYKKDFHHGIKLLDKLILPQIELAFKNISFEILFCTEFPEEDISMEIELIKRRYASNKNLKFKYFRKKFEVSKFHEDFIITLKKYLK